MNSESRVQGSPIHDHRAGDEEAPPAAVMQDFVFGGIEADESRLVGRERGRWSGVRHEYDIEPLDPQPGEPVTITVTAGPDVAADHVTAYVSVDNSEAAGSRGVATNGFAVTLTRQEPRWEALIWDYVDAWQGTIPPQADGTFVRYRIEAWSSADPSLSAWSREQHIDGVEEAVTPYAYSVDEAQPPLWAREAVVYQIFVDRFRDHRRSHAEHGEIPGRDLASFWGGTLSGIRDELEYIASLGVTAIWLTPIFRTPSYHGYDTTDFYEVDPRFGSNEELRDLVDAAHARGLRVILDLVANHVSLDFAPFREALADAQSPYRAWFDFDERHAHGYRTFFNVASMPQLNLDEPGAREAMCDVARFWLREYGVDGFRLDYAAGPSYAFWSYFRRACREVAPDCWLFGEATYAGRQLRAYTGRLDGCLDFAFARAVRRLCMRPDVSLGHFAAWVERTRTYFGEGLGLPAFLDNHDMNRFLYVVGGDKQWLRFALGLLLGLGESPVLYYGTEVGQSQPRSKGPHREESRHPMHWGDAQDAGLLAFTRRWIAARRASKALSRGDLRTLLLDDARALWLVERRCDEDFALLVVNAADRQQGVALPPGIFVDLEGLEQRGMMEAPLRSVSLLRNVTPG